MSEHNCERCEVVYKASDMALWIKPILAVVANGIEPSVIIVQNAQRLLAELEYKEDKS